MNKKCIIIGAGAAGISAAMDMISSGWQVTVLETRHHPGGRIYSFEDKTTGEVIDNGQHLLVGAYTTFLDILNKLGTINLLRQQESLIVPFIYKNGNADILDTSAYPGKAGLVAGLARMKRLPFLAKAGIIRFFIKLQLGMIEHGGMTCSELLSKEKQTREAIEHFWVPIILATLNAPADKAAASLLLTVLKLAFFAGPENSRILIPSKGLSELLRPLPSYLESFGSEIHFRTGVKKLLYENGRISGVLTDDGRVFTGDQYVSSTAPKALKNMLPDELQNTNYFKKLDNYTNSTIISAYLWFDKDFVPYDFAALLDTNIHWVFNRRRYTSADAEIVKKYPGHLAVTISGADKLDDIDNDTLLDIIITELKSAFPQASQARLLHSVLIRDKKATVLITPEMQTNRLNSRSPVDNLVICGDWTATGLPATIEGAAVSGRFMSSMKF